MDSHFAHLSLIQFVFFFFLRFIYLFWLLWVFVAAHRLSLVAVSGGSSPAAGCRLLIAVASLVVVVSLVAELGL